MADFLYFEGLAKEEKKNKIRFNTLFVADIRPLEIGKNVASYDI